MHRTNRRLAAIGIGAVTALGLAAGTGSTSAGATTSITPVIGNLNAPRGIAFDANGNMYVAESGLAGTGPAGLTHTGKVSKYRWGAHTPSWSTSFESLFVTENKGQPPDVLGPEGLSVLTHRCIGEHRTNCALTLITSESHDGIAAATKGAVQTTQAGHLFRINRGTGAASDRSDVGDQNYAWTNQRKSLFSDFPDSNPYGVLVTNTLGRRHERDSRNGDGEHGHNSRIRTFVADAGANTVEEIMPNGKIRVIAFLPNETQAPFRDATPTCIAQGPDGMLYVGDLHLVANFGSPTGGKSEVWRINPNANYPTKPKLWATGLTTVTACMFDRHGNFWATEMFAPNGASAPPGDIVKIPFHHRTDLDRFGGGSLPLPGGIAQGPDGALYVTINSANPMPGSGAVVRVRVRT